MSFFKKLIPSVACSALMLGLAPSSAEAYWAWMRMPNLTAIDGIACLTPNCGYANATAACQANAAGKIPSDYSVIGLDLDLNKNAGGSYIYLCGETGQYIHPNKVVSHLVLGYEARAGSGVNEWQWLDGGVPTECSVRWCNGVRNLTDSWLESLDLNHGVGHPEVSLFPVRMAGRIGSAVQIVAAGAASTLSGAKTECANAIANAGGSEVFAPGNDGLSTHESEGDANHGVGGDRIVICTSQDLPATPAVCPNNLVAFRGQYERTIGCKCLPLPTGAVWGSNGKLVVDSYGSYQTSPDGTPIVNGGYTDDSNLCAAALHAGKVGMMGGVIEARISRRQSSYTGSTANGITSYSYGTWGGSYYFP